MLDSAALPGLLSCRFLALLVSFYLRILDKFPLRSGMRRAKCWVLYTAGHVEAMYSHVNSCAGSVTERPGSPAAGGRASPRPSVMFDRTPLHGAEGAEKLEEGEST